MHEAAELLITCRDVGVIERNYVPAVRRGGWTGGIRLAVPGCEVPDAAGFRGLLLSGGGDVHPRHWDPHEPLHATAEVDPARDDLERRLVRRAWDAGRPILGICRGIQILDVALGGSLIQDIAAYCGVPVERHRCGSAEEPAWCHRVTVAPTARLAGYLETLDVAVNSRHHQAVRTVAPELEAVAWDTATRLADAPLVEAVEARDPQRWVVGVQWHPENLVHLSTPAGHAALGLFRAFVRASCGR